MGPLCCPKVLARFPNGQKSDPFVLQRILQNESQRLQIIQHNNDPSSMQSNNTQDWWTYHPLSISWRIHHKIPLPGESHRSVGWRENRPATQLTADAEVFYLIQERGGLTLRNLHSSLVRWRLCCWGHLVLLLGYSGAAPAGWSWSYCSHSGSRSVQWSPRSWTEYQWSQMRGGVNRLPQYQHVSFRSNKVVYLQKKRAKALLRWCMTHPTWMEICFSTGRNSPRGQQITDGVPGTYEDLRFVAPEHRGFAGWYLHIYIHLHGLTVVIWAEGGRRTCVYLHECLLTVYQHQQLSKPKYTYWSILNVFFIIVLSAGRENTLIAL